MARSVVATYLCLIVINLWMNGYGTEGATVTANTSYPASPKGVDVHACPDMCVCNTQAMVCHVDIPTVPIGIRNVQLFASNLTTLFSQPPFNTSAWENITSLIVITDTDKDGKPTLADDKQYTLHTGSFYHLKHLQYLRFTSTMMFDIQPGAFSGLHSLLVLNFTGNINVRVADFVNGLQGNDLENLRELRLTNLSVSRGTEKHFDTNFFARISHTKLEVLDLSYTETAIMDTESFATSLPYLKEIVFEHAGYLVLNIFDANIKYSDGVVYQTLRHVNLNYPLVPEALIQTAVRLGLYKSSSAYTMPNNFTRIKARACVPKGYPTELYGEDFESCLFVRMQFLNTSGQWLIFCLPFDEQDNLYLEELDIAENGIEHIDDTLTSKATRLVHLDLSFNNLYKMNEHDFGNAIQNCDKLQTLIVSHNGLTHIPHRLVSSTPDLELLDLSHNQLKKIAFGMSHLKRLKVLDLSGNNIHTIDGMFRHTLDSFISDLHIDKDIDNIDTSDIDERHAENNTEFRIILGGNPLACSCKTLDFMEWVANGRVRRHTGNLACDFEGETVEINDEVIDKSTFQCNLPLIRALVGSTVGVLVVVIVVIVICACRRMRQKRREHQLQKAVDMFQSASSEKRSGSTKTFPVFLSYSSTDADVVLGHIYPQMNVSLQSLLRTSDTCVATGDINFMPGHYVGDEVIRCIEASYVVVACISERFCKSHWCKDEILASQFDNKPLVLMFLENVEKTNMPRYLRRHFESKVRCWVDVTKGESEDTVAIRPSMDNICESIVKLMDTKSELTTRL